jgi:hypothetical protein
MVKSYFLSIISLLCLHIVADAQNDFWSSPNAYLGQTPPGNTPVKFAAALINDSPFFSMDRSTFSPDGKAFYYCSNNTWFSSKEASLRAYTFDGTKWKGPAVVNTQFYGPTMSANGKTLYLLGGGKGGVSASYKTDTGWSEPQTFLKRNYGLYDFITTNSGHFYAASNISGNINNYGFYDICLIPLSDKDTIAETLGKPVNTPGFDGDFFIAADESYMVVSAREQPDFECEIFISYHKKDGSWTNPKTLGPLINNDHAHRWGEYVTPDNKYLFYSYGHGPKDCSILWVRFDNLLETLRHTNFEPYVKDSISNQSLIAGQSFTLKIPDNTFIDDDGNNTLAYSASLPDGSALPGWIKFDARKKIFTGTAPANGQYNIKIIATDTEKATAQCVFSLTVNK